MKNHLLNIFNIKFVVRWLLLCVLIVLPVFGNLVHPDTITIYLKALTDAYLQVSVFVAATLLIFYGLENGLKLDLGHLLQKHKRYQIPIAAVMGALPGCGGAIMVMTQYSIGRLGFGALIAVLTSTMGDAAFLLIAKDPKHALIVLSISLIVGIIFGYIFEAIHGYNFLRPKESIATVKFKDRIHFGNWKVPWIICLIPGVIFGALIAFQLDPDDYFFPNSTTIIGSGGALLCLFYWFVNPSNGPSVSNRFEGETPYFVWEKVVIDTSFVSMWVIVGYLCFEIPMLWSSFDLNSLFNQVAPWVPLIAIIVGFLPGCGPQVIVTTLYLSGVVPFSAQIGNAISNDGDALFPALAISPKASLVATLYTAIPALLVAYAWFFLFE